MFHVERDSPLIHLKKKAHPADKSFKSSPLNLQVRGKTGEGYESGMGI